MNRVMTGTLDDFSTDLRINGRAVPATSGGRFEVRDPATGDVIAEVADGGTDDVLTAVGAADDAFAAWRSTPARERGEVLRRAYELMVAREAELAALITLENGKAHQDAVAEVRYAAEFLRWYSEEAVRLAGSVQPAPSGNATALVVLEPVGVSLFVTPWNFPAAMATRKIGPALAAGCTVVLKPASATPLTALALADVLTEAGAPAGTVNVVPARRSGAVVGAALADPRVRKLSFTGSTEVGVQLAAEAAGRMVRCSMELGGNAPFIVLPDADVDAAVEGALVAKLRNGGQACTAANRFYVHESVADAFVERLATAMDAVRVGPGSDPENQVGPLIDDAALEKVSGLVDRAVAAGARRVTGRAHTPEDGLFYPPTVLDHVASDAEIVGTEVFGPVAPVVRFTEVADAVRWSNDSPLGLTAYVYSRDVAHAVRVGRALDVGMVGVNRGMVSDPAAPFGGVKMSGLGREGGHEGILEYVETQYLSLPPDAVTPLG